MSAAPALAAVGRPHPSSPEAERAVLGAVLLCPSVLDELDRLEVDDLFVPAHREVLGTMRTLRERGVAIDILTVGDDLRARGQLGRLEGGLAFLSALPSEAPVGNVAHHIGIVCDLAARRRTIALAAEIASRAHTEDLVGEILEDARGRIDDIAARTGAPVPSTAELVDRLEKAGDPLPTGFRTLDDSCRGGYRAGRRVIVGGAPGAGKTTVVLGWALDWARADVPVAVLAADEAASDLLVRIGQMLGLDRDALEASDPATLDRLRAELRAIPSLFILDGDDGATVEDAVATVRKAAGDRTAAIVVDGVQTARAVGSDNADGPRARVDTLLAALRRASRNGLIVVATSELARGAYRSRDPSDRIDDLAAAKESGGIEYAAQTLLVLRPVADAIGQVDVAIAKNRGGDRTPLRLVLDFAHARAYETARPADGERDSDAELRADTERVREVLRGAPGVAGVEALAARLGIRALRGRIAVRTMIDQGEIRIEKGPGTSRRLFLADPSDSSRTGRDGGRLDPSDSSRPLKGDESRTDESGLRAGGAFGNERDESDSEVIP